MSCAGWPAMPAPPDIPVVVVTADVTPGQTRRAHALGARAVLAKPFDVAPFLTIVDGLLARKEETSCPRA